MSHRCTFELLLIRTVSPMRCTLTVGTFYWTMQQLDGTESRSLTADDTVVRTATGNMSSSRTDNLESSRIFILNYSKAEIKERFNNM